MAEFKPTLGSSPTTQQGKKYTANFNNTMNKFNVKLNEIDGMLSETEFSLKKKIFSLPKMEALVFADPKLSAEYETMAENGAEKYGYHYNETIMNMIFNDYVLNSPKYLQRYKMAIPKKKKRRDASGINQLKKAGEEKMNKTTVTSETTGAGGGGGAIGGGSGQYSQALDYQNNVDETTGSASSGQYSGPAVWGSGDLMKTKGKANVKTKPAVAGGTIIQEQLINYLIDPTDFERYIDKLNENTDNLTLSFDDDIKNELKNLLSNTKFGKYGILDQRVVQLMNIHAKWLEMAKKKYSAEEIAEKLFTYQKNLNNPIFNEQIDIENPGAAQKPNVTPYKNSGVNNKIIDKTSAFTSNTVKNWNKPDTELETNTLNTGKMDEPNTNTMEENEKIYEMAKSVDQQQAAGIAYAAKKGDIPMSKLKGAAKEMVKMPKDDLKDFASTKHDGLPEKVNEVLSVHDTVEYVSDRNGENPFEVNGSKWQFVNAIYPDGKTDIGVYRFGHDLTYDYNRWKEEMNINEDMQSMIGDSPDTMANKPTPIGSQGSGGVPMGMNAGGGNVSEDENIGINNFSDYVEMYGRQMAEGLLDTYNEYLEQGIDDVNAITKAYRDKFGYLKNDNSLNKQLIDMKDSFNNENNRRKKDYKSLVMTGREKIYEYPDSDSSMNESYELLNEINNELNAFSIHHNKLKRMAEDRKPSSLVLKDRLGNENTANFKKDLKNSSISKLVDIENSLEYKDQQTEIGDDPYKLGQDIEDKALKVGDMKSGEALKNVGDSANDKGDEIPKRNLTQEEQDEVNLYRKGLGDFVFDNKPGKRFEDRMKKDMGDKLYQQRLDRQKFNAKAPMYNKEVQPTAGGIEKVQFDKEKSGWNEREGIKETAVMGKYVDLIGKKNFIDFNLNEVLELKNGKDDLFEVTIDGLGNAYTSKVDINESFVKATSKYKFFTDGKKVFVLKNFVQKLTETEHKGNKPIINEQFEKMKHLLNFNSNTFVDTKNVKKNRGF